MARKKPPELTLQERSTWTELFDAGDRFRDLAPWRWMHDQPLFAVRVTPEAPTMYCSILGGLGRSFGLLIYDGPEGWACFQRAVEGAVDPLDRPYSQRGLTILFHDREDVDPDFRALLKELGRTYRGAGQWPEALVHRPGFAARRPSLDEARVMAHVASEATAICERARTERLPTDGSILVRCGGADTWERRPHLDLADAPVAPLDDVAQQRLSRIARRGGTWIGDHTYMPACVDEGPHPYFPRNGVWLDTTSGMILDMDLMGPGVEPEARLRSRLVDLMAKHGAPDAVVVRRPTTARALEALRGTVEVEVDPRPEPLLELLQHLHESMMGGR